MNNYDIVIGLEIHAELDTKTKAFCSCRNEFGALPNTQVCPVCLGLPGALPVLNRKAVEFTIMGGLSFGCDINRETVFERKNYFYPDLPKSYQITQLSKPLCSGGGIVLESGKEIAFDRIHLEEDSGKLIHNHETNETLIDFNRSGIPLIEMVTTPQVCTAEEIIEFIGKLKQTLLYSGVSKCKKEEGGLRFDLNISVNPKDSETLGERVEIKNLNSLKSIEKAIEFESNRHISLIESGGSVSRETRGWDEEKNETFVVREKERENDYRYFPDPDVITVSITDAEIKRLKYRLPELIDSRKIRLLSLGLSEYDAELILSNKSVSDYFNQVVSLTGDPKETANWIMTEMFRVAKEYNKLELSEIMSAKNLAFIIENVIDENITRVNAKVLFDEVIKTGKSAMNLIKELDLVGDVNKKDIVEIVKMLINDIPDIVEDYLESPDTVVNHFIGCIMKHTQGKARAEYIRPLIVDIMNEHKK